MKILFLYTKRMLAANKARTAVTFAGIVLSFALLTAVLTGTSSLFHFFSEYMKMRDGDYYGVIYNCDEEDEARLAQSGEVMQMLELRNEYEESFDIGMPSQTDQYEANMVRIVNVCLICFLVLIVLISLANIANTITTAVRLRTREYAMIKAAGCSKHTFLRMIFAENLSYTLRGFVIGGLMGALANYKTYSFLKYTIYTNKIIPIGLYAVGAAAFVLVMIFSTVYTWRKVKRGNICEELRQEAV